MKAKDFPANRIGKKISFLAMLASIALSSAAGAESFYYRSSNSIPIPDVGGTASLSVDRTAFRAASAIAGQATTTFSGATWEFVQSPPAPSLGLAKSGATAFSGTAPAVSSPTQFQISAKATKNSKSATTKDVEITVHPILTIGGGPSGTISGRAENPFTNQASFSFNGLVGNASYTLTKDAQPADIGASCPGLSFSNSTGKISGTAADACSVSGLRIRIQDSFDNASIESAQFSVTVTPANPTATVSASAANIDVSKLFPADEWISAAPKLVIIPAGVIVYSDNPQLPAMSSGDKRGGVLTIQIKSGAEIQAAGGAGGFPLGSRLPGQGGTAIKVNQSGVTVQNDGYIRAGGGGGGGGGNGDGGGGGSGGNGQGHNGPNTNGTTGGFSNGAPATNGGGTGSPGGTWGNPGTSSTSYGKKNGQNYGTPQAGALAGYAIEGSATYSGNGVKLGR